MTMAMMAWVIALPLLGVVTGLRTLTPIAVLCWFAYRGYLPVDDTWAFWTAKSASVIVFTVLAVGELIGDKLPKTPDRISIGPLLARICFGGLVGAIVATGLNGSAIEGLVLGAGGAVIGAFGGYLVRRELVQSLGCKDWYIAVAEDAIAVGCAILAMGVVTG
jgi:uncharacterized membrane protein